MIHERQSLSLGVKPGQHLRGIHARLHDFDRDLTPHWPRLFGQTDLAHSAFTDSLKKPVRTYFRVLDH